MKTLRTASILLASTAALGAAAYALLHCRIPNADCLALGAGLATTVGLFGIILLDTKPAARPAHTTGPARRRSSRKTSGADNWTILRPAATPAHR